MTERLAMGNPNLLMRYSQISLETRRRIRTIPEAILVEILARLPLRSIARFKLLCKSLKSIIESTFISLHRNSCSSWSLMFRTKYDRPITEAIGLHGCKTWDLPKSLASYIIMPCHRLRTFKYTYVASSNGLIWINVFVTHSDKTCSILKCFVGNPVLRKWVGIPPPDPGTLVEPHWPLNPFTAMVTRVDEDGIVSSFKLVKVLLNLMIVESMNGESVYIHLRQGCGLSNDFSLLVPLTTLVLTLL
ncbi:F-box protein [Cardamine amara subsp. amara]|uniref:F-box protein n=1 Tax=Cardamine amara subsp. amara TaxID=228776 RepID=A0ABD0ZD26_CARAN